jgi:amino acid transporter
MPPSFGKKVKEAVIGKARQADDPTIFHRLSLIAFFAWVGLGVDGLSSSCYGPPEAFRVLGEHPSLGIFVAMATIMTVFIISESYSQIIDLFPTGGGGYVVASKLLSPTLGMISGCALLIDYVLTITLSVASGTDALLSFLPVGVAAYKVEIATGFLFLLTLANLRGVKESVIPLVPVFLIFVATHVFAILYSIAVHLMDIPRLTQVTVGDFNRSSSEIGALAVIMLILKAYSMGAGTYTGIEAVSNGIPILREPKAKTAKLTMRYMAISLAFTAGGLMLAYILFSVQFQEGKTLNAVLFENITSTWNPTYSHLFVLVTLISEAAILLTAAQTGFLDGPRVLSNMALDRWFPNRFSFLSDRLVTHNGIVLMAGAAGVLMIATKGSVTLLVVFYSINVFITFLLSQAGMVRHWFMFRKTVADWYKKATINGIGLLLTAFILISVVSIKFFEGGWMTLLVTGTLAFIAIGVKRHYKLTGKLLKKIDDFIIIATAPDGEKTTGIVQDPDPSTDIAPSAKTAVIFVNGFNGLGLYALSNIFKLFGPLFKNFIFVQVGAVDAGVFKGATEIESLKSHVEADLKHYVEFMKARGYYAEGVAAIGVDVVEEIYALAPKILERFPQAVFFGGQLEFPEHVIYTRWLHNYVTFALQKRFYHEGIPFVILPIRVPGG